MAFGTAEKQVAEYQSKVEALSSELRKSGGFSVWVLCLDVLFV